MAVALRATWSDRGIFRMEAALAELKGSRRVAAARRALNHTGDKAYTAVKRAVTKQMGLASQNVFKDGRALRRRRASNALLQYEIESTGRAIRMKEFRWRKTRKGITAYPWGKRHAFKSAFVVPRWSGNLYRRRTSKRFPLEALLGPNINKEVVKDQSEIAFYTTSAALVPRIEHDVRVITKGVIS
jgi:hypothetical protein